MTDPTTTEPTTGPHDSTDRAVPRWAVVDAAGVVLAVVDAPQDALNDWVSATQPHAAGVRDITDLADTETQPQPGWSYQRETKTWTPPTEEQQ